MKSEVDQTQSEGQGLRVDHGGEGDRTVPTVGEVKACTGLNCGPD